MEREPSDSEKPELEAMGSKSETERSRILLNLSDSETSPYISGFAPSEDNPRSELARKKKEEREYADMLSMLLAEDPLYAQLYRDVELALDDAQKAVDQASLDLALHAQLLEERMMRLEEQGLREREEYRLAEQELERIRIQQSEIASYQRDVIDDARERMADRDDPLSAEELEHMKVRIDEEMPSLVKSYTLPTLDQYGISHSGSDLSASELSIPNLATDFDAVKTDIPELLEEPEAPHTTITHSPFKP